MWVFFFFFFKDQPKLNYFLCVIISWLHGFVVLIKFLSGDSYCMLSENMMDHKFLLSLCLLCAWHWSPMSSTLSVYLSNHTKWPPITCPIDLNWWWKLLDKTFIPPHYCSSFISSQMKATIKTLTLSRDKSTRRRWISVCGQAEWWQREVGTDRTGWFM